MSHGDSDFARVYDAQVLSIYGFLYYRVRDRELAEDLTQTTFERALRAWPKFDPERASERTWLLAIARNLLIDEHRRPSPHPIGVIEDHQLGHSPAVDEAGEVGDLTVELFAALEQLGDREREVLALRFGGDLTGPEIAEIAGLSLSNVQQIISRSLRRLRGALERSSS